MDTIFSVRGIGSAASSPCTKFIQGRRAVSICSDAQMVPLFKDHPEMMIWQSDLSIRCYLMSEEAENVEDVIDFFLLSEMEDVTALVLGELDYQSGQQCHRLNGPNFLTAILWVQKG